METRMGPMRESYNSRGIPSYSMELWHDGLKKHRLIKGSEYAVVLRKAEIQRSEWASQWDQLTVRVKDRSNKENKKKLASDKTEEAQQNLETLTKILSRTLSINDAIDWEKLKDHSEFHEPPPSEPKPIPPLRPASAPREPQLADSKYVPTLGFLDKLIGSRRMARVAECQAAFRLDHSAWEAQARAIELKNEAAEQQRTAIINQKQEE